jgi:hypothetical protein
MTRGFVGILCLRAVNKAVRADWTLGPDHWRIWLVSVALFLALGVRSASAQSATFAGNAQHSAQFPVSALHLNHLRWSAAIQPSYTMVHYGAPLVSPSNTVIFATISGSTYTIQAREGASGRLKYTLTNDFVALSVSWGMTYGPVLTQGASGMRLYYLGGGGTVYYVDNVDSDTPSTPAQLCFYMPLADYATNAAAFRSTVYINTPFVADTNGVVFFSFYVSGVAPAPLSTSNSGFVRIAPDGTAIYTLATTAAGDSQISHTVHNCAPALSNDGTTLYAVVTGSSAAYSYLIGLDATTLSNKYKIRLQTPAGASTGPIDSSTASPSVGPDGDVYFGVNGSYLYGVMLHYSPDLKTMKLPSAFGWDYTAGFVPTSIVKGYRGPSSYLLVSKYNNYSTGDYRVALLDPNARSLQYGTNVMREVAVMRGPTTGREWCINTPAVNIPNGSIYVPSEDGRIYCWNLLSNSLAETVVLTSGYGEPYVPTVVGPDGAVYTINGSKLFALDSPTNLSIYAWSSTPDDRQVVVGQPITFTAVVTNPAVGGAVPTGSVSFFDGASVIATNVPLTNGLVLVMTTNLTGGAHFINVNYGGDALYPTGMVTLVQRVHAKSSAVTVASSVPVIGSNFVTFTAVVSSPGGGTPTGMVTFWDGNVCLGQVGLSAGSATLSTTNLGVGTHAIQAEYSSDNTYTASTGSLIGAPPVVTSLIAQADGSFLLAFTNVSGAPFSVIDSSDVSLGLSNWPVLGPAIEIQPGIFQFVDPPPAVGSKSRFYKVRSP